MSDLLREKKNEAIKSLRDILNGIADIDGRDIYSHALRHEAMKMNNVLANEYSEEPKNAKDHSMRDDSCNACLQDDIARKEGII